MGTEPIIPYSNYLRLIFLNDGINDGINYAVNGSMINGSINVLILVGTLLSIPSSFLFG